MRCITICGTAGAGKSLLASKLRQYYTSNGAYCATLNLDPGVRELPYSPDVDIRDHIDLDSIMQKYGLGPNGALVMASDLAASKFDEIHRQVQTVNPDYLIVDTPGQIELFAYRPSGPFILDSIMAEQKAGVFLFDGALVGTPANLVSVGLLAASIKLRLNMPMLHVLTKSDVIGEMVPRILEWSEDAASLEQAVSSETDGEVYSLASGVLRGVGEGLLQELYPVSNVTGEGLETVEGMLARMVSWGEEVED